MPYQMVCLIVTIVVLLVALMSGAGYLTYVITRMEALEEKVGRLENGHVEYHGSVHLSNVIHQSQLPKQPIFSPLF